MTGWTCDTNGRDTGSGHGFKPLPADAMDETPDPWQRPRCDEQNPWNYFSWNSSQLPVLPKYMRRLQTFGDKCPKITRNCFSD